MELERDGLASQIQEVPVIEGELVATIRELAGRGVGSKTIARTVGVARNTVRRYLRQPIAPGVQRRPAARRLTDDARGEARACAPYRARTKGTTEAGVEHVKRNGLADLDCESFAVLERHLAE